MKTLATVLLSVLFGLQTASPTTEEAATRWRAESSAYRLKVDGGWTYVTDNRSFRFAEVLGDGGEYEAPLLLEETYHNERADFIEGVRGKVMVRAWTLEPGRPRELRWTLRETGNEGDLQDRFFRLTAWGCCDAPTTYFYYGLLTGKKLYVSNSGLLNVWGDGHGPLAWRYVAFGYASTSNLSQPPLLQVGTDQAVAQRFSVVSLREYYDTPDVFVATGDRLKKSLDLRGSPMSFVIVLRYRDGVELRIPVENGAIRPEKAALPKGYSLRPEN